MTVTEILLYFIEGIELDMTCAWEILLFNVGVELVMTGD